MIIDSNVILDVVTADPNWYDWSIGQLKAAALRGPLIANDVVFAEVSARYESMELVEDLFDGMGFVIEAIPHDGLFLAGKAHRAYRQRGGVRSGVLSDFLIGSHAAVTGRAVVTRDRARYRTYFPTVEVISPASGT